MSGLLDFLQSASNAAAGNVSGPVDLLSLALQKLGVPVPENAVGSSQWMREKGLMRDVPQSASSLAGETLGLLSPLAAARAPQIARGLLAAQDAAPQMMSRGAMVPANQWGYITDIRAPKWNPRESMPVAIWEDGKVIPSEMRELLRDEQAKSAGNALRVIRDKKTGILYAFPADAALHQDVGKAFNLDPTQTVHGLLAP